MNYFHSLVKLSELLKAEKDFEVKKFQELLKHKSVHERKATGRCVYPLSVKETNYGLAGLLEITLESDNEIETSFFNAGSIVSLFKSSDNIKSEALITATVKFSKEKKIVVQINADAEPDELYDAQIGADLAVDDRTYKVMEHTLNYFINTESSEEKRLLKSMWADQALKPLVIKNAFSSEKLNQWQNKSVSLAENSETFTAIHGPPGTGKTTTLVQCIKQLVKQEGKILVTANSNAAVDHLVKCMLKEKLIVVRVGNLARIDEEVQNAQIDVRIQNEQEYKFIKDLKKRASDTRKKAEKYKRSFSAEDRANRKAWYKESRELLNEAKKTEKYLIQKTLESAQVVATTLIGSDAEMLRATRFKTVVIDEAAQALIPAALTPLKRADKLVLAGDPFQLPPLVKNEEAARAGLSQSLLEHIMTCTQHRIHQLKIQYRMDELIMEFSNAQFYENELEAHISVATHGFTQDGFSAVEFIDTAGCDFTEESSKSGKSLRNEGEAGLITKRLIELEPFIEGMSLGIISPYRGQVNYLKEVLSERDSDINTIDAFQGQERDIIIVSLVRSNEDGTIGFLKDYRRMNVAMTRAKKRLILIGDSATIGGDRFYGEFLEFVEQKGSYRSAWEYASY
ncbi:MAG: AAA domain-containing protein [Flavobacteriales bacterium]